MNNIMKPSKYFGRTIGKRYRFGSSEYTLAMSIDNLDDDDDNKQCIDIIKMMIKSIDNGCPYDLTLITDFYRMLKIRLSSCRTHAHDEIVDLTNKLFQNNFMDTQLFMFVLKFKELDVCHKHFESITHDYVEDIIDRRLHESCNNDGDRELIKIMFDKIVSNNMLNDDMIFNLLGCSHDLVMKLLVSHTDLSQKHLTYACKELPYTKIVVEHLINKNMYPTDDDILFVCGNNDGDSLVFILEHTRFKITKQHFQCVFMSPSRHVMNKINILINNGYIPDVDDVMCGIDNHSEIPHIERFGIKLGKKEFELCYLENYFPNYVFDGVDKVMIDVAKACHCANASKIKKILKCGFVPSDEFMELLAKRFIRTVIFDELVKVGGKITSTCFKSRFSMLPAKQHKILCDYVDVNDELLKKFMVLNGEYECIKFDGDVIDVGDMKHENINLLFGIDTSIKFSDLRILLWNKMVVEKWLIKGYVVIPVQYRKLFGLNDYIIHVKDIDHLVCALAKDV